MSSDSVTSETETTVSTLRTHADLAPPFVEDASTRAPSVLLLSARGVPQVVSVAFCQAGTGSSRALQSPGCAFSRVPSQIGLRLVQSIMSAH